MTQLSAAVFPPPAGLLERESELGVIAAALDAATAGAGRLLVVEGVPGAGKTALLQAAAAAAAGRGIAVLTARGGELERDLAFGVARQLFEPLLHAAVPPRRARLLDGAGLAGQLLEGGPDRAPRGRDAGAAVMHGLYWLTVNVVDEGPVLLVVDDAHRADELSLSWLLYLARRAEPLALVVALAFRSGSSGEAGRLANALAAEPLARALRPKPLSAGAVAQILAAELAAEPAPAFCRACHAATGGNAFLVRALAGFLADEQVAPTPEQAARVQHLTPRSVRGSLVMRLASLPPAAATLTRALAIVETECELSVAAAVAGLGESEASAAADLLAAADVLAPERPLRFVHPLLRSGVYSEIPEGERRRGHAAAARALAAAGTSPERVAAHLLEAEPSADPWVVDRLRDAAAGALAYGAAEAATALLRRALSEPPAQPLRARVEFELGRAALRAASAEAPRHLAAAATAADDPALEIEALRELGLAHMGELRFLDAIDAFDRAAAAARSLARELALSIEAEAIGVGQMDVLPVARIAERLRRHPRPYAGRTDGERAMLAVQAYETIRANGRPELAAALARRALSAGFPPALRAGSPPAILGTHALVYAEDYAFLDSCVASELDRARVRGALMELALLSHIRGLIALRRGSLGDAEVEVDVMNGAAGEYPGPRILAFTLAAELAVERGDPAPAQALLERAGLSVAPREAIPFTGTLLARGRLRLAQGDVDGGLADVLAAGGRSDDLGVRCPAILHWRSTAALAFRLAGQAGRAAALAAEELQSARAFGAPRSLGVALRAAALTGPDGDRLERLTEAVEVLERSEARLEHARAAADLGAALRRSGHRAAARERLELAVDLAHRCGATALREHASIELRAAGARPRRITRSGRDALTPSEQRVCELAAAGLGNREIARRLFVTVKTVEGHLSSSYRKLDVRSRDDLRARLSDDD